MSECVVRMEFPLNCFDCPMHDWNRQKLCCNAHHELRSIPNGGVPKPDWCPIICQLPKGHGDLVDWKDVEKELDKSFCSVVDDGPCMGPYMLKRKEYPQALIERPIRVNIIVPAEK